MPRPLKVIFCLKLEDEIKRQLRLFQLNNRPFAAFARDAERSFQVLIPKDIGDGKRTYTRREPDISFKHHWARYPGVVMEVFCARTKDYGMVDEYILDTDGSVSAVFVFRLHNTGSKKATFTLWRPNYQVAEDGVEVLQATAMIQDKQFRTNSGVPAEGEAFRLSLRDFGVEELAQDYAELDQEIVITSEQLCDFLSSAEAHEEKITRFEGSVGQIPPGAVKRYRSQIPLEQQISEEK
ncbi:hypothetical protein PENFLA_c027G04995 [Penicillium flavigenum]|uniref:Uncharacterized protein n=1 Tax=Penicillium flavigenum TaxID=254877 RepID=A0A1V6SSQ8_9EURO|nr:hypothetical protein PENFLA_c027G04995 [Penicillium flavigenum]